METKETCHSKIKLLTKYIARAMHPRVDKNVIAAATVTNIFAVSDDLSLAILLK